MISILGNVASVGTSTIVGPFSDPLHKILVVLIVCGCISLNVTMAFLKANIVRAVNHRGIPVHDLRTRNLLVIVLAPFLVKIH